MKNNKLNIAVYFIFGFISTFILLFIVLSGYIYIAGFSGVVSEDNSVLSKITDLSEITDSDHFIPVNESDFQNVSSTDVISNNISSMNLSDSYVRTYSWNYEGCSQSFTLTIPKEYYNYYRNKPHSGKNYDTYALSEYDRKFLGMMVDSFKEQGVKNGFTADQNVLNVISFVQAMPYTSDNVTTGYDEYPRYPVETLVDGGGDCEDSAILAAAILSEMGYGTILIGLPNHMALGVKGSENIPGTYYEYNGSRYYYVETTSSGYQLGEIPDEFRNAQAQIYSMNPIPNIYAEMNVQSVGYDSNYVYYKVKCDFKNNGAISAKNVHIYILAEASPYDMSRIWSPEHNTFIGNVEADGTGWAEGTLKVPRKNNTRFTCIISGDNFNFVSLHTNVTYIN